MAPFAATTNLADELVRPLWGGETRHVTSRQIGGVEHTWVVGDGGFIRHRIGNGPFEIQGTPLDARFSLHDVWFLPDGSKGWACGNGGRVLETSDLGATWQLLPPTLPTCNGSPATIWRVRFVDALHGFVCGLGMFCVTVDGGQTWAPVTIQGGSASRFEFYSLEVLGTLNDFVVVAAGQEWSGHCVGVPAGTAKIFRLAGSGASAVVGDWSGTLVTMPVGVPICEDPWDLEFEPNPANIHAATGWLCGGTGSAEGMILKSTDSGASWEFEFGGPNSGFNTCYGIAVRNASEAVAVGYGGVVQWRNANGQWRARRYKDGNGAFFTGPLGDAAWTAGASPTCVIAGSWGFLRERSDFTLLNPPIGTWTDLQPASAESNPRQDRYFDVAFRDDLNGFLVGQNGDLVTTADGGCTLLPVSYAIGSAAPDQTLVTVDYSNGKRHAIAVGLNTTGNHQVVYNAQADVPGSTWSRYSGNDVPASASFVDLDFLVGAEAWALGTQTPDVAGNPHLLSVTADGGATWTSLRPAFANDFTATGLVGIGGREAVVVGSVGNPAVPAAYEIGLNGAVLMVQPIVCPPGLTGALRDVAGRGASLAASDVLAVGGWSTSSTGEGYVLKYVPGSSSAMSAFVIDGPLAELEFTTVAMAGGGFTLVGMRQRATERHAASFGKLLVRSNGVNPTWSWARSRTNKSMRAIHVASGARAFLLAKADGEDISGEFATVNDSTLLLWDPQ